MLHFVEEKILIYGGSFDVTRILYGEIVLITPLDLVNCNAGQGIGGNVFRAHCGAGGSSGMGGTWGVQFRMNKDVEQWSLKSKIEPLNIKYNLDLFWKFNLDLILINLMNIFKLKNK